MKDDCVRYIHHKPPHRCEHMVNLCCCAYRCNHPTAPTSVAEPMLPCDAHVPCSVPEPFIEPEPFAEPVSRIEHLQPCSELVSYTEVYGDCGAPDRGADGCARPPEDVAHCPDEVADVTIVIFQHADTSCVDTPCDAPCERETPGEQHRCDDYTNDKKHKRRNGLLCFRKWWERLEVELSVGGRLIKGVPIFIEQDTIRVVNKRHSYFIPLDKVDYICTTDGLDCCRSDR